MSDPSYLLDLLRKNGCYLENGHFRLVSGKHSDSYLQVRIGMMHPQTRSSFADALVDAVTEFNPTCLASSSIGGLLLASEAAKKLGIPTLIGRERGKMTEWVNAEILAKAALERIVMVADVVSTGGSLSNALDALHPFPATLVGVITAVDRRSEDGDIRLHGSDYPLKSLIRLDLKLWEEDACELPGTYKNLHNPEKDFIAVILSMPQDMSEFITDGYRLVYELQQEHDHVALIDQWRPWLPALIEGLPLTRVAEDSELVQFIRGSVASRETDPDRRRVMTDLVGHLLVVSQVKVESRSLGCSVLLGERHEILHHFDAQAPVEVPEGVTSADLAELIPYYDAVLETDVVFLFDKDGELFGARRLVQSAQAGEIRGIQVLRQVTDDCDAVGFVVRRGRRAVAFYRDSRLEATAELSEQTGLWQFNTPLRTMKEITNRVPGVGRTLELVLEIAREMVTKGYGGLFVVGDVPATLGRKDPKVMVTQQLLSRLGTTMVGEIAKLDGAVFVSKEGMMQAASIIIVNAGAPATEEATPAARTGGSRREAARRTSQECENAAVVCISQNGAISIFVQGEVWSVSEPITGVRPQ